jgi:hypothetical protein
MTATASSVTATRINDTATFFIAHLVSSVMCITRIEIKKSVIYTAEGDKD